MKYLVLVSHGDFANGLQDALSMLAGKREDVIAVGLENGKSADEFADLFRSRIEPIGKEDEVLLLGDLIGGSPLTTAMNVLAKEGMLDRTQIIGGMNLPLALTAVLMKDSFDPATLAAQILGEAHSGLREFEVAADDDEDDV